MGKIKKSDWFKSLNLCAKGKHKLRTNHYGVTWCVRCGLLSNTQNAQELDQEEVLVVENENQVDD
jgi:hypothetical protein